MNPYKYILYIIVAGLLGFSASMTQAQQASSADDTLDEIERSMYFIEQSSRAMELYGDQQYAQAMPIYKELYHDYSDQDSNGLAAIGYADSLYLVGQKERAIEVYQDVIDRFPHLADRARQYLLELRMRQGVSDALLAELRASAEGREPEALCMLSRALERRAHQLLTEAADWLEQAGQSTKTGCYPNRFIRRQSLKLKVLAGDLQKIIEESSALWGSPVTDWMDLIRAEMEEPANHIVEGRVRWQIELPDERRAVVELAKEGKQDCLRVLLDGHEVELDGTERALVDSYVERINSVILDAGERQRQERVSGQ